MPHGWPRWATCPAIAASVHDVAFVVDAPTQLAATDGAPRSRIQVAELGAFWHGRYGDFKITAEQVASWQRNFQAHYNGEVPIDLDHATDKGGSSEAAGWIKALQVEGSKVYADVEWTPLGAAAIAEKRYRYISPTYGLLKDERGKPLGDALMRAGLTNNPHFRHMPAITLSAAVEEFAERRPPKEPGSDSRPAMSDLLKTLAKLHGLPEDADEAKVLEAATAAAKPPPPTDTKTLEAMAQAEGKVLLTADQVATLTADAAKGVKAETDLAALTFETAYKAALSKGRIDAKPETREMHAQIFELDREKSLKLLESLPEGVVNLTARGEGGDAAEVPTGYDADSVLLDRKVQARMADKHEDYPTALSAVLATDEMTVV